jgi:flagellar protein FliS
MSCFKMSKAVRPTKGEAMAELNQYQKTAVTTASPIELVLMVYDECIRSLIGAEDAFSIEGPERIEQIGRHLLHAQDAITELSVSLDMERGGEIASNLERLYDFMTYHLSQANVKKELKPVLEVRDMMADLRGAWSQVAQQESVVQQPAAMERGRISGRYQFSG